MSATKERREHSAPPEREAVLLFQEELARFETDLKQKKLTICEIDRKGRFKRIKLEGKKILGAVWENAFPEILACLGLDEKELLEKEKKEKYWGRREMLWPTKVSSIGLKTVVNDSLFSFWAVRRILVKDPRVKVSHRERALA